jgi:hypothetical protein
MVKKMLRWKSDQVLSSQEVLQIWGGLRISPLYSPFLILCCL